MGSPDRSRGRLPLAAAAVVVPTVLAGLTLVWPRPQIEDGLTRAATETLAAAGLPGAAVAFSGRDATVSGVTEADAQRAVAVVRDVAGVRVAEVAAGPPTSAVPPGPTPTGATPAEPTTSPTPTDPPVAATELDLAGQRRLQAAIDALGSPIAFAADSPRFTPAGALTMARVVELVAAAPGARVQVDGFVAAGPGEGRLSAQELSDRRAAAVRDALVAGGVPADRITARGLGEGPRPVPDAAGRRVTVTVVGPGG